MTPSAQEPAAAPRPTIVGTRGSRLATAQTATVVAALRARHPGLDVRSTVVSAEGDRVTAGPLPSWGRGVFVRDIELAILGGGIDLAVHSLKDVPPELPPGLALLAIPARADPGDVLVTADGRALDALPEGARVGTSSLRRGAFLLAARPDLRIVPVRGNVDTRWRKLRESGDYDALVLAAAGLDRLGLADAPRVALPTEVLLPAPGQGALALQGRAGDAYHAGLAGALDDPPTSAAVRAERRLVRDLDSGCRLPVSALATPFPDGRLRLEAAVAAADGRRVLRDAATGRCDDPEALGAAVARRLLDAGAGALLRDAGPVAAGALP